jgi:hypothetical protein
MAAGRDFEQLPPRLLKCHAVAATDAYHAGVVELSGHALSLVRFDP